MNILPDSRKGFGCENVTALWRRLWISKANTLDKGANWGINSRREKTAHQHYISN